MAIKAGQILHVANQFVVDRIQTGGPGQLNIPQDRVYELGNYQSVGIVRDIPDLTFSLECLDVDTEVEALLTGSADPSTDTTGALDATGTVVTPGTKYDLSASVPIDIVSPWKSKQNQYDIVRGVVVPYLFLESASYRYGLTDNAGETFSLRGDSLYYVPGSPWQDITTGAGLTAAVAPDGPSWNFAKGPALAYDEGGTTRYALSVTVDGVRQVLGTDYTETATGIVFTPGSAPGNTATIHVTYGSATAVSYTQTGDDPFGTGTTHLVHQGTSVKPAAIRGKDIDVFFSTAIPGVDLGAGPGAPVEVRWPDVQSATLDWSVTLDEDREFGNYHAVSRDATDIPNVTGTVELRPRSVIAFFDRLRQITGVSDVAKIMGPESSLTGALRVEIRNPQSGGITGVAAGTVLKTHYVPAARFTMPGYSGTVQQKLNTTLNWTSDDGLHYVWKGSRTS